MARGDGMSFATGSRTGGMREGANASGGARRICKR
jgi:hypothetical protein